MASDQLLYVVKLENCGLPVECMSLIILSYSAVTDAGRTHFRKIARWKNGKSGRGKLPAVTAATAGVAFLLWRDKIQGSRAASNADIAVAFKPPGISADGSGKSVCGRSGVWQPACGNAVCA